MRYLNLFEEFKIKKTKKIYKHLDKGKGGVERILGNISDDTYLPDIDDEHIDLLSIVLKSVTKRFGLKSNVKYINSGTFGMAFVVDDKIIKLTSNKSEAMVAKSLIGRKIPHCVNYYDIVYIKRYNIYAILMDKAEKLSPTEKGVVGKLSDSVVIMNDYDKLKKKFSDISDSKLKKIYKDFREMYKSLKDNNISIQDLHEGNIGYINDKMVHFDIMGDTKKKDIEKISKIKIK